MDVTEPAEGAMTDDLVRRLREWPAGGRSNTPAAECQEAADRIEQLERESAEWERQARKMNLDCQEAQTRAWKVERELADAEAALSAQARLPENARKLLQALRNLLMKKIDSSARTELLLQIDEILTVVRPQAEQPEDAERVARLTATRPTQAELYVAVACLRRHSKDAFTPEELILAKAVQRWQASYEAAEQPAAREDARDAARYRWLRDMWPVDIGLLLGYEAGRNPDDQMDAAIDAARGAGGGSAPDRTAGKS